MIPEVDISWVAGVIDAEGSFGLRRHPTRPTQVLATAECGLVHASALAEVKDIVAELSGASFKVYTRRLVGRKDFYCFKLVSKKSVFQFTEALLPFVRVKRHEARLQHAFLKRAVISRHVSDEYDFALCDLSYRLKHTASDCSYAVDALASEDFELRGNDAAWLAGYTDGDGCVSMCNNDVLVVYPSTNGREIEKLASLIAKMTQLPSIRPYVVPPRSAGARPLYRLNVTQERARRLLPQLVPHLRIKKLQAQAAIEALSLERKDRTALQESVRLLNGGLVH